jgi:hypothetical protein
MTTDRDDTDELTSHGSATEHVLTELQLYGHRPFQDEPDPRPRPRLWALRSTLCSALSIALSAVASM